MSLLIKVPDFSWHTRIFEAEAKSVWKKIEKITVTMLLNM